MGFLLIVKLVIDGICGVFNALGGWHFLFMRRYLMPLIIAVGVSMASGCWWLGFTVLPVMGTLCIGYDFGKHFFGRGFWLAIQAFMIGLDSFLLHHLAWYFYAPYILGAFLLAGFLYSLEQIFGDFIFGAWLAVIIFILH